MSDRIKESACDLMIIGRGMAGMAAGLSAVRARIDTIQVGMASEIGFASGLLDLLGVHPASELRLIPNPWEGIERLRREEPLHPYAVLDTAAIREAFGHMLAFLEEGGYPHVAAPNRNVGVPTPAGTLKFTYAVPHTMAGGVRALAERSPCLIVDFKGLRGFSARQIAMGLSNRWPDVRPVSIEFPDDSRGERHAERMARALDAGPWRARLIDGIKSRIGDARAVGMPAVLGLYRTRDVMAEMQQGLGIPVFEIPTFLPGVTGTRLQEIFDTKLPPLGLRLLRNHRVRRARRQSDGRWSLEVVGDQDIQRVVARSVLLCSGRFLGRGLNAGRHGIRETVFDLPVTQPADRSAWHRKDLFHPRGHPVNRAGLRVDSSFRPVNGNGQVLYSNLFAAGSILAHQDWIRQKCGSGLAIATAFGAVQGCRAYLGVDF